MYQLRRKLVAAIAMGLLLLGGVYLWMTPQGEESGLAHAQTDSRPAAARAESDAPTSPSGAYRRPGSRADRVEAFRLPRSEDHVRAWLLRPKLESPSELVVHMTIDEGWHVNANPASLPFLIATAVDVVDGNRSVKVRYPIGQSFRPEFASEAIQVYEGTLEIPVALEDGAGSSEQLALRFQACDSSRCLPPHRAVLTLNTSSEVTP